MNDQSLQLPPSLYQDILEATKKLGFTMASEIKTCSMLRTLASSKRNSTFLELGTGTGLSTSWILDGMDMSSTLTTVDFDANLLSVASQHLGQDKRVNIECMDGEAWITNNKQRKYDFIFADTWHGKYLMLDEVLEMLNPGAFYIIDDMIEQPNWPDGHQEKVNNLLTYLDSCKDLVLTRQAWASGLVVAVKR